jgi:hypothetical protein
MKESVNKNKLRISRIASRRLAELLKPYHSGWVALSPDERQIVAASETLHEAREQAIRSRVSDAIFIKVIPPQQGYLPQVQ